MADDPGQDEEESEAVGTVTTIGEVVGAVHTGSGDMNVDVRAGGAEPDNLVDDEPTEAATADALASIRIMDLEKELEERNRELEEKKKSEEKTRLLAEETLERVTRLSAELENYRKRSAKELAMAVARAIENGFSPLMEILDNLDRVLDAPVGSGEASLRQGVAMTVMSATNNLKAIDGFEAFTVTVGTAFDPQRHCAVSQRETVDVAPGTVAIAFSKGYTRGDKVLRPAFVAVATAPAAMPLPEPASLPEEAPTEAPRP
jgi:molecular chaperone GrpE